MAKTISRFFDKEFSDDVEDKNQKRVERKRFNNQKSYYRVKARREFVDEETIDMVISKIDKSTSIDDLGTVKGFFKDMRTVRNPKSKDELVEQSFTNIIQFLEKDEESLAEEQDAEYEREFWERYLAISSDKLSERIIGVYHTDGVLAALAFMDMIAGQGFVNI